VNLPGPESFTEAVVSAPARVWSLSAAVLTSALLAACASAPKPPPAAVLHVPAGPVPEGPIALGFAWYDGLTAQVTYSTSRLRTGDDPESGESRYRMVVRGEGDVLKVVSEDVELPPEEQQAAAEPVRIPTVVVNRRGDFLRIEGTEALFAHVETALEEQGETAEQRQKVLGILRAGMVEGAKEMWHVQVAAWHGVTLEQGKPVTRPARLLPAALANVVVPVTETLSYEGAVPCAEGETERRCVRLVLLARSVESELAGVKAALLARVKALAGEEGPDYQVDELQVEHRTELVTEPGTLIPHRVRTTRRTRLVFLTDKALRTEDDQREEVEYVYVYDTKK
jgi:hypothetical protein